MKRIGGGPSSVISSITDVLDRDDDTGGVLESVSIGKIQFNPDNPRKLSLDRENPRVIPDGAPARAQAELDDLISLAASIESVGLLQPVGIYRHGDHFVLSWGERRLLAHRLLGRSSIPAKILPKKPRDLIGVQLIENLSRSDLSFSEKIAGFRGVIARSTDPPIRTGDELSSRSGIGRSQAFVYLAIAKAPDDVHDAIHDGRIISADDAYRVAQLKSISERTSAIAALTTSGAIAASATSAVVPPESATAPRAARGRGRPPSGVALPRMANPGVLRYIAEHLATKQEFAVYQSADWTDLKVAGDILRQIIKKLERRLATVAK